MYFSRRAPVLAALALIVLLTGCVTTNPDLRKGIDPEKAYVIVGKEVRAEGFKTYLDIIDRENYFLSSRLIKGMEDGPELIFRKYDFASGAVPRGEPASGDKSAFRFYFPVQPMINNNNPSSALNVVGTMGLSLLGAGEYNRYTEANAKTDTGYVVYEVFEVEPGPYVFERFVYKTHKFYGNTHKITRHHMMMLKDQAVHEKSRIFNVRRGEIVYAGDAVMKFEITVKKQKEIVYGKGMSDESHYEDKFVFRASKWTVGFEADEARMRAKMAGRVDLSRVISSPMTLRGKIE
mgnify:FL=1